MDIHNTGNSCTSAIIIEQPSDSFVTRGLPDALVSDNGPCFVSHEFEGFMEGSGVLGICGRHPIIPPLMALQRGQ